MQAPNQQAQTTQSTQSASIHLRTSCQQNTHHTQCWKKGSAKITRSGCTQPKSSQKKQQKVAAEQPDLIFYQPRVYGRSNAINWCCVICSRNALYDIKWIQIKIIFKNQKVCNGGYFITRSEYLKIHIRAAVMLRVFWLRAVFSPCRLPCVACGTTTAFSSSHKNFVRQMLCLYVFVCECVHFLPICPSLSRLHVECLIWRKSVIAV